MMKTRERQLITAMLLFTSIVFTSCQSPVVYDEPIISPSQNENVLDSSQPSYLEDVTPITFDWYVNFPWFTKKWGGDATSEYITEKTGVSINFITPSGDASEKVDAMIATDTLPDIITLGNWEGKINDMISSDMVYALDELSELYDPYFMQVAKKESLSWYTKDDGHVYGYPNASFTSEDYEKYEMVSNQTFMVRKDIYEAIGSPDMRTPEGFLDALRSAKEMFGEVNGEPLIPIGLMEFNSSGCDSLEDYLQNFLAIPRVVDGKLYDRDTDPEYIRWLKVFRQANEEGLMAIDVFIDGRSQMEEKIEKGRYFSMLYQRSDLITQNNIRYLEDPNSVYIAVDGPSNKNLDPPTLEGDGIGGWTLTLISKNCKDPERAIKFLSYMISEEGQRDLFMGPEGVTFEYVEGKPTWYPVVQQILNSDRNRFDNLYGASFTYWMLMNTALSRKWEQEPVEPVAQPYNWTKGKVYDTSEFTNIFMDNSSDLNLQFLRIDANWGEVLPQLIQSESEEAFDQIYNEYIEYRKDHQWDAIFAYQQEQYKINRQKLGRND